MIDSKIAQPVVDVVDSSQEISIHSEISGLVEAFYMSQNVLLEMECGEQEIREHSSAVHLQDHIVDSTGNIARCLEFHSLFFSCRLDSE